MSAFNSGSFVLANQPTMDTCEVITLECKIIRIRRKMVPQGFKKPYADPQTRDERPGSNKDGSDLQKTYRRNGLAVEENLTL